MHKILYFYLLPRLFHKYSEVTPILLLQYPTHFLHYSANTRAHIHIPPTLPSSPPSPQCQLVVRSREFYFRNVSHICTLLSIPPDATTSSGPAHPSRSESANYSPGQIQPTTFSVNKVLLECNYTHSFTYPLWLIL